MSVFVETTKGDIVIDLFVEECPKACKNFLKLCKIKYYHNCLFHTVQRGFIAQTGDPTNTGKGGSSVYGLLYGDQARCFEDEIRPTLRHKAKGMVATASGAADTNASQFYFTTGTDLRGLDDKHTIFGEVAEGLDILEAIDRVPVDKKNRPLQNVRIRRTEVFEDPFEDPDGLEDHLKESSPEPQFEFGDRLEEDWVPEVDTRSAEEIEASTEEHKAAQRKIILEMVGDRPEADATAPEEQIFVCKLNPVTTEEDLETIFSRFGIVTACDIVRDRKTGDSLSYAFITFDTKEAAEESYLKMNNTLVDDRRIKVDFSQSMHHLWKQFKRVGPRGGDAGMKQMAHGGPKPVLLSDGKFELKTGQQYGYGTGHYSQVKDTFPSMAHGSCGSHASEHTPADKAAAEAPRNEDRHAHHRGREDAQPRDRKGRREEGPSGSQQQDHGMRQHRDDRHSRDNGDGNKRTRSPDQRARNNQESRGDGHRDKQGGGRQDDSEVRDRHGGRNDHSGRQKRSRDEHNRREEFGRNGEGDVDVVKGRWPRERSGRGEREMGEGDVRGDASVHRRSDDRGAVQPQKSRSRGDHDEADRIRGHKDHHKSHRKEKSLHKEKRSRRSHSPSRHS